MLKQVIYDLCQLLYGRKFSHVNFLYVMNHPDCCIGTDIDDLAISNETENDILFNQWSNLQVSTAQNTRKMVLERPFCN